MTDPVFFPASRCFRVGEIATLTGAELRDASDSDVEISRLAPASEGGADTLVFVDGARNAALLERVSAAAVLCRPEMAARVREGVAVLMTSAPQRAFVQVAELLFPSAARLAPITGETGVSDRAHVAHDAEIEPGVVIESGAVVAPGAAVGRGSVIGPGAVVGPSCRVGRDCFIGHGATVQHALLGDRVILHPGARIGQDGFGYIPAEGGLRKVPQLGRVVIQNDVEIGANTTVDRGALSDTVIGEGTKIDNLVQIAHNVRIGRVCVIAGLCGLSGSVTLGDRVMLGGRVGIADHVRIGSGAQIAGSSGVMTNIPDGERWGGTPAQPYREALREIAAVRGLLKKTGSRSSNE